MRDEVAGVGTRLFCDGAVKVAARAESIADLYGTIASATPEEVGGTCAAEVAWPAGLPFSAERAVARLSSGAARHAGYVVVLPPVSERRGLLGPEPWPLTTARGAVVTRVGGVESMVRLLEHRHSSREPWWSLAVEPVRDAMSSDGPARGGHGAR